MGYRVGHQLATNRAGSAGIQVDNVTLIFPARECFASRVARLAGMPSTFIAALLSPLPPGAARNWLKALPAFCRFAVAQGLLQVDPTLGVKLPKFPSRDQVRGLIQPRARFRIQTGPLVPRLVR